MAIAKRISAGIRSGICYPTEGYKVLLPDGWRNSKYEILTDNKHSINIGGTRYYRIRALRRIYRPFGLPPVEPGDLGGYVALTAGTCSLSNEGDCWIADEAFVSGYVSGDSQVTGHAHVGYPSKVSGQSLISDYAQVIDGAEVSESMVTDYAQVVGRNLWGLDFEEPSTDAIGAQTQVVNHSWISGRARVSDGAYVYRFSTVRGSAVISGNVCLANGSTVAGVLLASEHDLVFIRGEFIDEPMNMWGYPRGIIIRDGDGNVNDLRALGDTEHGEVLPCWGGDYSRGAKTARKIAEIYGIELEFNDTGNGTWASSFDKSRQLPREVHVSPVTGIEYFEPATKEEREAYNVKAKDKAEKNWEVRKEEWWERLTKQTAERAEWFEEHPEDPNNI